MAQSREEQDRSFGFFPLGLATTTNTPMLATLAELNGALLEGFAAAQKEWADFMHRRIQEDVAVTRQLIGCHSLTDMQDVYSQYLKTAVEQYQQQSEKVVQRGQLFAQHMTETFEAKGKEATRARH